MPDKLATPKEQVKKVRQPREKQKLSSKETKELDTLPQTIETLEEEKQRLLTTLNSPEFYGGHDLTKINGDNNRLKSLEKELDKAYYRWNELENMAAQFSGKADR